MSAAAVIQALPATPREHPAFAPADRVHPGVPPRVRAGGSTYFSSFLYSDARREHLLIGRTAGLVATIEHLKSHLVAVERAQRLLDASPSRPHRPTRCTA